MRGKKENSRLKSQVNGISDIETTDELKKWVIIDKCKGRRIMRYFI